MANTSKTILVTGGTGKVARHLVPRLRMAGHSVRAVSRRTAIPFDWHDKATWSAALDGVDAVYLVEPDVGVEADAFAAAAVEAGARRLVAQSGRRMEELIEPFGGDPEAIGMYVLQRAVQRAGVEWTVLQPNNFNQNFSEGHYFEPLLEGRLVLPLEGALEPLIDVADIAAVAAAVLTEDGHDGQTYELTGPESLAYADAVEIIAKASGRSMTFATESHAEHVEQLRSAGVPEPAITFLTGMYQVMRDGGISSVADGVQRVLGREPVSFADWAARAAAEGAWDRAQ